MGKQFFILLVSQLATNSWWYCYTQFDNVLSTPTVLPAVATTGYLCWEMFGWIQRHWDD